MALAKLQLSIIGQIAVPVTDLERAVTFYPGSSTAFDDHERCDQVRRNDSSTDQRRESVNI